MFDNLSSQPKAPVEDIFADAEVGAPVRPPSSFQVAPPPPPLEQFMPESKPSSKKWLWIVIIVVVLGGGGAGAYWWYSTQKANQGTEVVNTNDSQPPLPPLTNDNTSANVNTEPEASETRDYDGDGLSDQEEVQQGTFVDNPDSDSDGLTDGEEVKFWHTNPLNSDTDGDGYLDKEEIDNGYNPNDSTKGAKLLQLPNQELNMEEINNIIKDIDNQPAS